MTVTVNVIALLLVVVVVFVKSFHWSKEFVRVKLCVPAIPESNVCGSVIVPAPSIVSQVAVGARVSVSV
jgi:hypothetical protein